MSNQVTDLDDLVMSFDSTDTGRRFIEAWKRARIIEDIRPWLNRRPTPTLSVAATALLRLNDPTSLSVNSKQPQRVPPGGKSATPQSTW
jgi:hypothetical protein